MADEHEHYHSNAKIYMMRIDLPPRHISRLLDVYYQPFLPARKMVDVLASAADAGGATTGADGNTVLLLVIRGYTGQLSPSSSDNTPFSGNASTHASTTTNAAVNVNPSATPGGGGVANKIAGDLWYEQSRTLVMNRLRRGGSSLESVQTLLLCALRDQGKGAES